MLQILSNERLRKYTGRGGGARGGAADMSAHIKSSVESKNCGLFYVINAINDLAMAEPAGLRLED